MAAVRSMSRSSTFASASFIWPAPGSMPSRPPIGPILRIIIICCRKSSRVKSLPAILAAIASAWSASKCCSACSIRVSMSPMPRIREAIRSGWKTSKSASFSPVDANMIGWPVTCRTDSAAPPRASPSSLVSTTPLKPTPSRNASAVATASWPIIASTTNRISFGLHRVPDVDGLLHHLGVDAEPAGGVDDDDVVQPDPGVRDAAPGHRDRVADAVARLGREDRHAGLLADDLQLLHRVGPLQVGGDQQRGVPLALEPQRELAGQRRLAGALQAGQHDHRRRVLGVGQPAGLAAEDGDQFLVDDLDDLLRRVQRGRDVGAGGPLLDLRDERADDRQRDVGLEQRDADLATGRVDVGRGQPTLAAQVGEDRGKPVGEGFEHERSLTPAGR